MFERPRSGERAVLVHLDFDGAARSDAALADPSSEFQELANSAGARTVALVRGKRRTPDPRYFIGTGKAQEIGEQVRAQQAELVIFNHDLSPAQERNLERLLECRVLDRNGLILDIFAQRARSFEGKLQVELAQLRHLSTRLVRGWTHLERQKGGIGLRGPGETQLETDRRLLAERIKQINRRLEKVDKRREQGRQKRRKADVATVALVGYTNAGKSTLFNTLTAADSYAADQLFATLDPALRRLPLENAEPVVLADTVGFVSDLPHELVAAFRATLQETAQADLLLHVIDGADPERQLHAAQVEQVLKEIGAELVPQLRVYNKVDRIENQAPRLERDGDGRATAVWLSALNGDGVELLLTALTEHVNADQVQGWLRLSPRQAKLRARLYDVKAVRDERGGDDGGWWLQLQTTRKNFQQLCSQEDTPALLTATPDAAAPLLDPIH